jgi:hypothetical protein
MSCPCYVVLEGHEPGVYYNWADCQRQVHRFPSNYYEKYNSYEEGIAAFKSRTNSNPALAHDDFYLQNPTAAPPYLSFKTVIIVVLLIFVCLLWNKL